MAVNNNKIFLMKLNLFISRSLLFFIFINTSLLSCKVANAENKNTTESNKPVASIIIDTPTYYSQCRQNFLRVGEEDYQDKLLSLRGLSGVYVNIDSILKSAKSKQVTLDKNLKKRVSDKLNHAGLRLLSKEETEKTPGQPQISIYTSYPAHIGPFKKGAKRVKYRKDCCTMSTWATFSQGATILREPLGNYQLGTWGKGFNTHDCSDIGGWMSNAVLDTIDAFLEDKAKGEKEYAKLQKQTKKMETKRIKAKRLGSPAETGLMECNTSLMLYIEMFKANKTDIKPSQYFILDKLAATINSCPKYHYILEIIETHAEQHLGSSNNRKLAEKRAASIKKYLLEQGVNAAQFKMMSFGKTHPDSFANSDNTNNADNADEDFASRHRIVVTPVKSKTKIKN